jgi:hypothetical protein
MGHVADAAQFALVVPGLVREVVRRSDDAIAARAAARGRSGSAATATAASAT